jgi:hypothetical protein
MIQVMTQFYIQEIFKVQEGGKRENLNELTLISD